MATSFQCLKRWLPAAGVVLAVVLSVSAQSNMKHGQAIFFSSADNDEVATDLPSLTAHSPEVPGFAEAVQAPTLNFDPVSKAVPLPAPSAPVVAPPANDQTRRLLDDRENWMLLTPDEILRLSTSGKILGGTERDAAGRPKHLTAVERFLQREDSRRAVVTNDFLDYNPTPRWDFLNDRRLQMNLNPGFLNPEKNELQNPAPANAFFSGAPISPAATSQNFGQSTAATWPKLFTTLAPSAPSEPSAAQKADMDEFRKLLRPILPSDATAKIQSSVVGLPPAQPAAGTGSKLSDSQMLGASFAPLDNSITKPVGTASWPTLINQKSPAIISLEPEWKPQLPPWMRSGPQPGVIPQRKF